jgi:transglutaminase-like putative cysteine protease
VIYNLSHRTTYRYEDEVTFARCALRLTPCAGADQAVLRSSVTVSPTPSSVTEHVGPFGERVMTALIERPHRRLVVEAKARVDVRRRAPTQPLTGPSWEVVRELAFAADRLETGSPAHFLFPSRLTPVRREITDYARRFFTPGRPVIAGAHDMAVTMRKDFTYDPKSTEVSTPAVEAFRARRGVCQDYAHIMISGLHGLGLPVAYVSGYLRTFPAPGQPRLEGADATHAWVNLWCGDDHGWVGFDPTNAVIAAENHIVLAAGRDYSDVAPIGGMVLGSGGQKIDVAVDVVPAE